MMCHVFLKAKHMHIENKALPTTAKKKPLDSRTILSRRTSYRLANRNRLRRHKLLLYFVNSALKSTASFAIIDFPSYDSIHFLKEQTQYVYGIAGMGEISFSIAAIQANTSTRTYNDTKALIRCGCFLHEKFKMRCLEIAPKLPPFTQSVCTIFFTQKKIFRTQLL